MHPFSDARSRTRAWVALVVLCAGACDGSVPPVRPDGGHLAPSVDAGPRRATSTPGPTRAVCPPGGTPLRWESFGRELFDSYCLRCHASEREEGARNGAPTGFDWDSLDAVRTHAARIDAAAGAGPARINVFMPPSEPAPTVEERDLLAEWLACGAP